MAESPPLTSRPQINDRQGMGIRLFFGF